MVKIHNLGYKLSPYSPTDLALSNYIQVEILNVFVENFYSIQKVTYLLTHPRNINIFRLILGY